jgi:hypothetical protein
MLSGAEPEAVLRCVRCVMGSPAEWSPPEEYLRTDVSSSVIKIVLGNQCE